jgi:hypothetical protein
MPELTRETQQTIQKIANAHGVSVEAVEILVRALAADGAQVQFNHPELGGMGQWSRGGMIMIGDLFNSDLKHKVAQLCEELSPLARDLAVSASSATAHRQYQSQGGNSSLSAPSWESSSWWPENLGSPASSGSQNDMSYAYFPALHRLVIREGGHVRIYDTGDHVLGGVSQQQSGDRTLRFTSQHGVVRVADLPLVSPLAQARVSEAPSSAAPSASGEDHDVFAAIGKLTALRDKNILSEAEFAEKKAELLRRV